MIIFDFKFVFIITSIFLIFLICPNKFKKYVLLFMSLLFYALWDLNHLTIMLLFIFITHYTITLLKIENNKYNNVVIGLYIFFSLSLLAVFKYNDFFIFSFSKLLNQINIAPNLFTLRLIIPLGISYYIFQSLGYVIDAYYKRISSEISITNTALFISFFPIVTAGPIERFDRLTSQFQNLNNPDYDRILTSLRFITLGFFRKVVLADNISIISNKIINNYSVHTSDEILFGFILFSLQIYFDFSGYSNIAIGIGKFLGIDLVANFRQPYTSKSIGEFWSRWHISLSTWFRDYLFLPLNYKLLKLLNKIKIRESIKLKAIYIFVSLITMTIIGIWHGSSLNYMLWGLLIGIYLSASLIFKGVRKKIKKAFPYKKVFNVTNVISVFILMLISWALFRITDLNILINIIYDILKLNHGNNTLIILFTLFLLFTVLYTTDKYEDKYLLIKAKSVTKNMLELVFVWMLIISFMVYKPPIPFIYTNF